MGYMGPMPGTAAGGGLEVNEYATLKALLAAASGLADDTVWKLGPSAAGQALYGIMKSGAPVPHPLEMGLDADLIGFGSGGGIETLQGTIDDASGYPALVAAGTADGTRTWGKIGLSGIAQAPLGMIVVYDWIGWSDLATNEALYSGFNFATTHTLTTRHVKLASSFRVGYAHGTLLGNPEAVVAAANPASGEVAGVEAFDGVMMLPDKTNNYPQVAAIGGDARTPAAMLSVGHYYGLGAPTGATGWDAATPDLIFCLSAAANASNKVRLKWLKLLTGPWNR